MRSVEKSLVRSDANPGSDSVAELLDQALESLRSEWRDGCQARKIEPAVATLREAQNLSASSIVAIGLARVDLRFDDYQRLAGPQRQAELQAIANEIKRLQLIALTSATGPTPMLRPKGSKSVPRPSLAKAGRQLPLTASVQNLPRVGTSVAKRLSKLGLLRVGDVLDFLPRRHIDYSKTATIRDAVGFGAKGDVTVRGKVVDVSTFDGPPPRVTVRLADATGVLRVTWFNPYMSRVLKAGTEVAISGSIDHGYGNPSVTNPDWELIGGPGLSTGRLTPVYYLTQGVSQKQIRLLTRSALDATTSSIHDFLPEQIRRRQNLMPLAAAYEEVHYPSKLAALTQAQLRLSFDELFLLQLGLIKLKKDRQRGSSAPFQVDETAVNAFIGKLPYSLTRAQERVLREVLADLRRSVAMARLLQGDVGSGKTVIAAAASLVAHCNQAQTAVMAPTEILAEQHYQNFKEIFSYLPVSERPVIEILTGSTRKRDRDRRLAHTGSGEIDILVGTHALIEDRVNFASLGLVIIDEQHRFGVRQRGFIASRTEANQPHVLSMTATPIPRTLNLVLNGDLDVSVIDEMPPGRIPITTRRFGADDRMQSWELVRNEIQNGRQAFVICPLVEESESLDAKAAISEAEFLQTSIFPELKVQVLHGRMSGREKDRIMEAFRNRETDILVSTSVIEVGIDIPNATVMLIEGADRFGLAQLHQFRGRVGRGPYPSYCLLLADDASDAAEQRLEMMVTTNDGFALAELDLKLRGPGDFLGPRQSGLPELGATVRWFDTRTLDAARNEAEMVLDLDSNLQMPANAALRERAILFWKESAPDLALS